MTTSADLPRLPFSCGGALEVPALYAALRGAGALTRVQTPAGDPAWLVTRHAEVRALFTDPRLTRSLPDPDRERQVFTTAQLARPFGTHQEAHDHDAAARGVLTAALSRSRLEVLGRRMRVLADGLVDALVAARGADGTSDLHAVVSAPFPALVVCELLGVPQSDREQVTALAEQASSMMGAGPAQAMAELVAMAGSWAQRKRSDPDDDVISHLVALQRSQPGFDDDTVAVFVAGLVFAGVKNTMHRIDQGVLLILTHPVVRDRLVDDPRGCVDQVVEEVLRLAAPGAIGMTRYAHSDVPVGDVVIARGDAVILSIPAANRDERVFADPLAFDPTRAARPHVTFGYGRHFCPGSGLARAELAAVFSALLARLPGLRLGFAADEVDRWFDRGGGGFTALPVAWGPAADGDRCGC